LLSRIVPRPSILNTQAELFRANLSEDDVDVAMIVTTVVEGWTETVTTRSDSRKSRSHKLPGAAILRAKQPGLGNSALPINQSRRNQPPGASPRLPHLGETVG